MKIKHVVLVLLVLVVMCSSLTAVSAGWFDFLNPQNNIVNISDYQFNIPDGYELDNSADNYDEKVYWFLSTGGSYGFISEIEDNDFSKVPDGVTIYNATLRHYVNSAENKNITIRIDHPVNGSGYSESDITLNKTISDIEGQFNQYDDKVSFAYLKDDNVITITAPDESLISNIIVNS